MTLIEQTIWLCGGLAMAMSMLVFVAWWFWYPQPPDEPEGE